MQLVHNENNSKIVLMKCNYPSCLSFVSETRKSLKVEKDQNLLMGIMWLLPKEKEYLKLFPEVIFCNIIADVNKDQRQLLTCTGKDNNGNMFTYLRAFLPNQKQWIFCLIFSNDFPWSFAQDILSQVCVIITHERVQEFSHIDDAMAVSFPNAYRVRYSFHLVRMGWKTQIFCRNSYSKVVCQIYDTVRNHLKL